MFEFFQNTAPIWYTFTSGIMLMGINIYVKDKKAQRKEQRLLHFMLIACIHGNEKANSEAFRKPYDDKLDELIENEKFKTS